MARGERAFLRGVEAALEERTGRLGRGELERRGGVVGERPWGRTERRVGARRIGLGEQLDPAGAGEIGGVRHVDLAAGAGGDGRCVSELAITCTGASNLI